MEEKNVAEGEVDLNIAEGDGYSIRIKDTHTMAVTNINYATIAVTGPDGVEKWLYLPIKAILPQLLKGCKTS